jgi:DNA-directed RNA polymerase subunit RPC12/RpoP
LAIEFSCQHCGKQLSTSEDKAGRKAKCPQCGEVIVVPAPAAVDSGFPDVAADDYEESAPPLPGTGGMKNCPMCGESIPRSARKCDFCGEQLLEEPGQMARRPRKIEAGDVMSFAWERFTKNMGLAIGANIVNAIVIAVSAIPLIGLFIAIAIASENNQEPDAILLIGLIPAFLPVIAVSLFLMPGLTKIYLGISRGDSVDIGMLFSGGKYFVKASICTILFGLMVGLGMVACVIPGILLALRYWPYLYVILDEDPPGLECFNRSAELTQGNWGSVLVLGVVGFLINMAAQAICGLIQLFTQPLNSLFFSTAYVKITGQDRGKTL